MRLDKSSKKIAKETNLHHRSINRRIKAIADSGIAPTITDREEPLPPLIIDLEVTQLKVDMLN
jgi:hypothetical protein